MIYTTARTYARDLARDPSGNVDDAKVLAIFQDMYEIYWETFLRERLSLFTAFVTFGANQYVAEANTAVRDVQSLVRVASLPNSNVSQIGVIERDEFEAVCADADADTDGIGATVDTLRWGMRKKLDNSKPVIAVYPISAGHSLGAYAYAECNTLSTTPGSGDLQGDVGDGYAVARMAACEIMNQNGEEPGLIEVVFRMLDQKVQGKMNVSRWRTQPRDTEDKEQ